ncbi:MAG: hypothetical protein ACYCPN_05080 [Thermoplasmata archaeon]
MIPALAGVVAFLETGQRYAYLLDGATLVALGIPAIVRRWGVSYRAAARWIVAVSVGLALVSVATGLFNGGTDEAFTTPRYLSVLLAGHNPYVAPLVFTFSQTQGIPGHVVQLHSSTTFIYLPLTLLLTGPGLSGTGFSLGMVAAWGASVYLLRHEPWSLLVWGSPVVAVWAANGFNDFAPLALLTFAFVVAARPRTGRALELLALGMKQFAPFVVAVYYFARRRWVAVGVSAAVTVLYLVPFLLWGPVEPVVCAAFLIPLRGCPIPSQFPGGLVLHWNYYLWPVWAIALFGPRLVRWAASPEGAPYYRAARAGSRAGWAREPRLLARAYWAAWWAGFAPPAAVASPPTPPAGPEESGAGEAPR